MIHSVSRLAFAAALISAALPLNALVLTNGTGEGDVELETDATGFINWAYFNPVGPIGRGSVIYDSFVTVSPLDTSYGISSLATNVAVLSASATSMTSTFTVGWLDFVLTQTLSDAVEDGVQTGSVLTQSFVVRNTADVPNSFAMNRYLDGDLYLTDGTLADGGGVTSAGSTMVLYETDLLAGSTAEGTFLGITATGGVNPGNDGFSIARCCGLQLPMSNDVFNDTTGDNVIDIAYDVTLQLRDDFYLQPNEVQTYITTTIFGNGEPPAAGGTESTPLLPTRTDNGNSVPAYDFEIPIVDVVVQQTFFIDPEIAIGYTYEVTGAEFYSVTAPSLAAVPDADGLYSLIFGGNTYILAAGEEFIFGTPVTSFRIEGISIDLMLDPTNPLAFVTGIALDNLDPSRTTVIVTQTPITRFVPDTPAVPLPSSILLLLGGMGGLAALRLNRRRAA